MAFDLFTLPPTPKPAPAPRHNLAGHGIQLRFCQREDADAIMHAVESGARRPCCVGATGIGKGAVIAEVVGRLRPNGKVLCLIDRAHLVHQLADEIERHLGIETGRVADGSCEGIGRPVVVATVQAMYTPDRTGRPLFDYPQFGGVRAVVADECHRFFSDCYRGVLTHFIEQRGAVVPMFTATPVAANGSRWESFVDWTAAAEGPCMRTTGWCIRNGYLVPPVQAFVRSSLDLAAIHARLAAAAPDPDDEDPGDELADVLLNLLRVKGEKAAAEFASGIVKALDGRRAIVFAPARVDAAKAIASWLNATRRIACEPVWGGRADKMAVLDRFRAGTPDALVGVNMLMEGFDCHDVSAVFMCRLLKAWRLVAQCVGRALRPHRSCVDGLNALDDPDQAAGRRAVIAASPKPDAVVADLVGIDDRIVQASAVDVLYAGEPEDVRREVAELGRGRSFAGRDAGDRAEADKALLDEARSSLLAKQHDQLAEMARRRAMAGDVPADVTVTYSAAGGGVAVPSVPTPRSAASLGEKAMFVAVAVQYDAARAMEIADRTPRHVLKGMTFGMKRKMEQAGGRPDWQRARRTYPAWAASTSNRKAAAR